MILTYKIKHNRDFSKELAKARQIADFAIKNKGKLSSASVRQFGLVSTISNQILRKYGRNKKAMRLSSVKLSIPGQRVYSDKSTKTLRMPCVQIKDLAYYFDNSYSKINQVEIDNTYCYVSVSFPEPAIQKVGNYIGVDLNTTGHCAVIGNVTTGKVIKLGKQSNHIHKKYRDIRSQLKRQGKFRLVKKIGDRESRIIRDMNHKISNKVVCEAIIQKCNIKMEDLKGILENSKRRTGRKFRHALNSWSFYQLKQMIEYKAKKQGVLVTLIDPAYTSQTCSRCGSLGERNNKSFKCSCGHVDHADSNASFNISKWVISNIGRLTTDSDVVKGSTGTPKSEILRMEETLKLSKESMPESPYGRRGSL